MSCLVHHGYEHEDPNLKEGDEYSNLWLDFSEEGQQNYDETENLLKLQPNSSEDNANRNRPKFGTRKRSWMKYFSFSFFSKFKQHSKTSSSSSSQKKQASQYSHTFTYKSKHCPKFGSLTRVACKMASIHEAIRRTASNPLLVSCFHPKNAEEIEVQYIQLEKLGYQYQGLRREAFGPIYMVT